MSSSNKPVIVVAVLLGLLIVAPLALLLLTKMNGPGGGPAPAAAGPASAAGGAANPGGFELRQLAAEARDLLDGPVADSLRAGDLSLDFVAGLKRTVERADAAARRGDAEGAAGFYREMISAAEAGLGEVADRERARDLAAQLYAELERLRTLGAVYANSFAEAVAGHDEGSRLLEAGAFGDAIDRFEMAVALLGDLEARAIQQVAVLLEAGSGALEAYDLEAARTAFSEVLRIAPQNRDATDGLETVAALEGIAAEVRALEQLESAGRLEDALAAARALAAANPGNPFIETRIAALEQAIADRDHAAQLAAADAAEAAGDLDGAIAALGRALAIRPSEELAARRDQLEQKREALKLEQLLERGYAALLEGRFADARDAYKEAVDLAPDSDEARRGLQKASTLRLAAIRFEQNLAAAEKYAEAGRFPLAGEFFNQAMASRPDNLKAGEREAALRDELQRQGKEVPVTVVSDNRTYVSMIGVFPPEKLRSRDLELYPDVYKLTGTRSGYRDVEIEVRVDARRAPQEFKVVCTEEL